MIRTDRERAAAAPEVRAPTVLAVLVVKDGIRWLRDCLQGLSAQSYPRLGIVAVDNGSTDGSREVLDRALGRGRVLQLDVDRGVAGAVTAALDMPAASEVDYLLIVHDDTALEPGTVERMVEAGETIDGVGVVGPKVVDWDDPRMLREVGRSTDRFGHPFTPLQEGELDHGQYDRVLEVLFVSSCAMLVRREAWQRAGRLDERLGSHHEDLDFCWRARVAGFRVVMTPLARVRHLAATSKGARPQPRRRSRRYYAERASLAAMLKNYGALSLLRLVPLYMVAAVGRMGALLASRRFDEAYDLIAAWGWNVAHLPGTLRRRMRAQSTRAMKDRDIRRFMQSGALPLPRWVDEATVILAEADAVEDDAASGRWRAQTRALVASHPVLVASAVGLVVGSLLAAPVLGADPLTGGVAASFPPSASGFFTELASGVRTTVLGGAQAASPALAALGALSWLLLGSTSFAQRLLLVALPAVAAAMCYRAVARQTGERIGATVAAGAYAMSPVVLWSFSQARLDLLVGLAALPVVVERLSAAVDPRARGDGLLRLAAGIGVALAVGAAFWPGIVLPAAAAAAVLVAAGPSRAPGARTAVLALGIAAVLLFPLLPDVARHPDAALSSLVGEPRFFALVRTVLGPGPATWAISWFLPVGAACSLVCLRREHRVAGNRLAAMAVAGTYLAWLAAAGYLPRSVSNPAAYISLVATAEALLIGFGVAAVASGFEREAFGIRQVAAVGLTAVLGIGLALQSIAAVAAPKDAGPDRLPAAWPVVAQGARGAFRVLWIGRRTGRPFPPPGGDPSGILAAGDSSLQYAITDRSGVTALDTGRAEHGAGYRALERTLAELAVGETRHLGALLAPFGVRFVVAASGDLPTEVRARLDEQLDIDAVPALGLEIYRVPRALPEASVLSADTSSGIVDAPSARQADLQRIATLPPAAAAPLTPAPGGWSGEVAGGGADVYVADQFSDGWRLRSSGGAAVGPRVAFGWAVGFEAPEPGPVRIAYAAQWIRTLELVALAVVWAAALWLTRKPASR